MVRRQAFAPDREGTLEERLGLLVAAGGLVEQGQVVEVGGEGGVLGAERLLTDREGTLVERLGLLVAAGGPIEQGQVVEGLGNVRVLGAERLLVDREGTLVERLGLGPCRASLVIDS